MSGLFDIKLAKHGAHTSRIHVLSGSVAVQNLIFGHLRDYFDDQVLCRLFFTTYRQITPPAVVVFIERESATFFKVQLAEPNNCEKQERNKKNNALRPKPQHQQYKAAVLVHFEHRF